MKKFIYLILTLLLAFATIFFSGWVLMTGWNLCIVPVFSNLPDVSYLGWVSVGAFLSLIRSGGTANTVAAMEMDSEDSWKYWLVSIFADLFMLFLIWILTLIIF